MAVHSYRDLIVWQRSMELVREVYRVAQKLPKQEAFILGSQMLRAGVSVPSNIAEGFGRNRPLEFKRFLEIASASCCELETQLSIAGEQYQSIDASKSLSLAAEVQRMIRALIQKTKY